MARLRILRLLLKEIKDQYVQENFFKLKLYLEDLEKVVDEGATGPQGPPGVAGPPGIAPATSPRLTQVFTTDVGTAVSDLVYLNGVNSVTKTTSNSSALIPNGIFGVGFTKPSPTLLEVMFIGIGSGYSGLSAGVPIFISPTGVPTHMPPTTGTLQQIGFAINSTEIFYYLQQAMRRA